MMAQVFRLPDMGEGLTEAEVVRWLVGVGERVEVDQPVVEVETDKAVVEIPCPYSGVVLAQGAAAGETIGVGEILVVVGQPGEAWPPEEDTTGSRWGEAAPIVGTLPEEAEELASVSPSQTTAGGGRIKALPVVRKLAREMGVDLERVTGTGPGGRITREDVLAAAQSRPGETPEPSPAAVVQGRRVRMSKLRRTIAENMARSWREKPHVTTFDQADATRLLQARQALQKRHNTPIPIDALLVKAVLPALDAFPDFEATIDGDHLVYPETHHVGIAVDTPDGLVVAVIPDTPRLGLLELAAEITHLAQAAKQRKLAPDRLTGQTFTISNIGAVGGGHGTPIIPPHTTAILSVGKATPQPVARDGQIQIVPLLPLSLSYDHRIIDGAQGRRFITHIIENLQEPALFLT